jgi:hypothetical protein
MNVNKHPLRHFCALSRPLVSIGIWFQEDCCGGKTANTQDAEFSSVLCMLDSFFP